MEQHYHPLLYQRLRQLFDAGEWDAVTGYLEGLTHSQFRTAGYIIGERLLTDVPSETFWTVMQHLILWNAKAFTVTLAKAAALRLQGETLSLEDKEFRILSQALRGDSHLIDRQKILMQWLPVIQQPAKMEMLFDAMDVTDSRKRIEFLLHTDTLPAAFVLLRTLRFEEHDQEYLTSVCRQLIRRASTLSQAQGKADSLSFNLASLLRTYFDLPDLRGTFSLALESYELSRLDTDYDTFCRVITKV